MIDAVDSGILLAAGIAAGTINTVVGSGSLVTFPTLLALGYPAVTANITNNLGILPGSVSGAFAYRAELAGQRGRVIRLAAASLIGGLTGAILLLHLPAAAFAAVVPALILLACVLVVVQPWLRRRLDARAHRVTRIGMPLILGVLLTGMYGGYFGAAQGVILIALLTVMIDDDLQRLNALKNVLVAAANGAAAVVFVLRGDVAWDAVLIIAIGSTIGGQIGARIGRRMPAPVYRAAVLIVGIVAFLKLVTS